MGDKKYTRRHFFRSLNTTAPATDTPFGDGDDPLFKKYSRKKLTPRSYSPELAQLKVGTEDSDVARVGNPVTSGLAAYNGTWSEWEVLHLLRRTNFGCKKAWVDMLLPLGPSAAADAVLNITTAEPSKPLNWYQNIAGAADAGDVAYGADWTSTFFTTSGIGGNSNNNRISSLRRWLFNLTLNGNHTIREKMVWFWYHFIPIDFQSITESSNSYVNINSAPLFHRYFKLLRDNAQGNFKTLIRAIATEPAMMYYLNNQANTKTAPDENFARELMELFTLGKDDPNNSYTQADVVEAAKVLTGWRVENMLTQNPGTNFKTANHLYGVKTFSSFFGGQTITSTAPNGQTELDDFLTMIFNKSTEVSRYICRRLYRYFVYYDIDANIEANVIVPLAQTFVANSWNIKPVLEQLFKSQHFYDMANRGAYIKTPFDLVAGTLNVFGVNTADASTEAQYRIWSKYNDGFALSMDQQMGTIPNVSGWNAFYQTPAYHQYWINSNAIQKRFIFIRDTISGYHTIGNVYSSGTTLRRFTADTVAFAKQFGNTLARNPNDLVATSIKYLLCVDLSQAQKDQLKGSTLLSGQTTDAYWTTAWDNWTTAVTNQQNNTSTDQTVITSLQTAVTNTRAIIEARLKNLLNTICQLAEYQLM